MLEKIVPADLEWDELGQPRSSKFGDLYFNAENGVEESRHVFLDGNNLKNRWLNLKAGDLFVIAETGFGSGLNLLTAAQLWQQIAPERARLQFISVEQFPMTLEDLKRTHQLWGGQLSHSASLIENYPTLSPGFHRFNLSKNIEVTIIFDEIESGLTSLCPALEPRLWDHKPYSVDAWFLDGFAPAKNPQMWTNEVFLLIHRLSRKASTAATFTAAGDVRRATTDWGFRVSKTPGFGKKRDMLCAVLDYEKSSISTIPGASFKKPIASWALPSPEIEPQNQPIAIIGAGIAGATLAAALAKRGKAVQVYEQAEKPAYGASKISQIALYAKLSPEAGELEDFMLTAMSFSQRYYRQLLASKSKSCLGSLCGLVQLPRNDKELEKMRLIGERLEHCRDFVQLLSAQELSVIAGIEVTTPGLYFPNSGWLEGPEICEALLDHPNIHTNYQANLVSIDKQVDKQDEAWQLSFENGSIAAHPQTIFCNAHQAKEFRSLDWLPTRSIRGQVSYFHESALPNLATVICRETQLTPATGQSCSTGSTYDLDDSSSVVLEGDHQRNLNKLRKMIGPELDPNVVARSGQAGVRCATPDYLPVCGPVADAPVFLETFSKLRKDAKSRLPFPGPIKSGLFINVGFGSRGFTYAPLCAEVLAAQICGEVPPLPEYLRRAIHPSRFLVRGLRRGRY